MMQPVEVRRERFEGIIEGARKAMALQAVFEIGVFDFLVKGPATLEALAEAAGVVERKLGPFLDTLCAMGLLLRGREVYRLVPGDQALFQPEGPLAATFGAARLSDSFRRMARAVEVLRTGRALQAAGSGGKVGPGQLRRFLRYIHSVSHEEAEEVAGKLGRTSFEHVLDLGCGGGTYSLALLRKVPGARATAVDSSDAEETVLGLARAEGMGGRMRFRVRDIGSGLPRGSFDLVILSNLIHCYPEEWNRRLLLRIRQRLAAGGRVAIKDYAIDADRQGPEDAVMFRLSMAMFTDDGDLYPASTVRSWLREAGFSGVRIQQLESAPGSYLVIGSKPKRPP